MLITIPTFAVFLWIMLGLMTFGFFLTLMWIVFRLISWPLQHFWFSIKSLFDRT